MASAIKMSTGSFYKGETALLAQALRAARANGVLEPVIDDIRRNYPAAVDDAPRMLQSIAAKRSLRRRDARDRHDPAGGRLDARSVRGDREVYRQLSETEAARLTPEQVDPRAELEDVLASIDGGIGNRG